MSDELKTKLEKTLIDLYHTGILYGESQEALVLPSSDARINAILIALNEIDQAYKDVATSTLDGHLRTYLPHDGKFRHVEFIVAINPNDTMEFKERNVMTGPEWYERFEDELGRIRDRFEDYHQQSLALEAARRAAGLESD